MSGKTISTSDTKIEALSLQSSAYGVTIPLLYGVNRIAGNMFWYGGFKATPHTTSSSGKGGSVNTQNTTFTYSASVMMGLCEGQITGVSRVWKGKKLYAGGVLPTQLTTGTETFAVPAGGGTFTVAHAANLSAAISVTYTTEGHGTYSLSEGADYTRVGGTYTVNPPPIWWNAVTVTYQYTTPGATQSALAALGLSFAAGALGQSVWPYLTTAFPAQALGYSGLAAVFAQDYELGTGAQVDNHTFEVQGPQAYSISATIPDANPASVTWDVLINARYGAAFPSAQLGSPDLWSSYCLATGLLMSPAITTQMRAGDFAALMGRLTNTAPVWSSGTLKMIPYGDTPLGGNGATYTPNLTPAYDLGDDDFVASGGDPIRVMRKPQADAFNHIRLEFLNRANLYNIEVSEAKDSASIDANGLRSAPILSAHWICDASVARQVTQLLLQRALYVRNTFEFTLLWTKAMLEPMSLVTLTDAGLGFSKLPVRITEISEAEDGDLSVIAEEFPLGVATAATYPMQTGAGYQHDYSAAPGSVVAPVIFEAPGALTANGLELYVAAAGSSAMWGGCRVWVSLDGTSYKQVGTINGGSRYGTLNGAPSGGAVHVKLVAGTLTSGSSADALALNTLCFIGGASREYFTYAAATLTAALAYDLTYVSTGVYGSQVGGHSSGDPFVRVDASIAKSGPIDLGYVGKTVHVKCTSFNIYGAAEESLASVTDYTYVITGAQVLGNAGASAYLGIANATSDSILSQGEKPPIILDYSNILADQSGINAQAAAYAVNHAAYDSAVAALVAYLGTLTTPSAWNNLAGTTTIVGTVFRSTFASVYAERQALLNATAAAAGTVATWPGVSGPGKPVDNATKNSVYYQSALPTSPTGGDLWYSIDTGSWETYVAGAWQVVSDVTATKIAAGISGQGALATLNTVDTPQIAAWSTTEIYSFATGSTEVNVAAVIPATTVNLGKFTRVAFVTFTPSNSGLAQLHLSGQVNYTSNPPNWQGFWTLLADSSKFDGTAFQSDSIPYLIQRSGAQKTAVETDRFLVSQTRSIPVIGGVSYTFGYYVNKFQGTDSVTLSKAELRIEVVKR